jgi:2-polyprenyl-3-methyl-5-hydroxy-6-metoxy-1,4-benzoquinol methylase
MTTSESRPAAGESNRVEASIVGFHRRMLNDRTRTQAFLQAIHAVVRPGDVVVDIGTGTGVLAMTAARAGARHVYAIEAGPIASVAARLVEWNGLADRVTVLRGRSSDISLPERADVMVSELIGNAPFSERILDVVADALRRLLQPDARVIPSGLRVYGVPITIPDDRLPKARMTEEDVRNWKAWYGLDYSPLLSVSNSTQSRTAVKPQECTNWSRLGAPSLLASVDLQHPPTEICTLNARVMISADGVFNGLLMFFEADLGPATVLSTDPRYVGVDNHWQMPLIAPAEPRHVYVGNVVTVTYCCTSKNGFKELISLHNPARTQGGT